jgi:hypothetical protein
LRYWSPPAAAEQKLEAKNPRRKKTKDDEEMETKLGMGVPRMERVVNGWKKGLRVVSGEGQR